MSPFADHIALARFQTQLLEWYATYRRQLPWRDITDPYRIWVSEVILQQTRVEQALDYYKNFLEHFPNIASLASADEEDVLNCWQGLGYYSRARNMHTAAKQVMERFGGEFPRAYEDVLTLKGVGEYTAAAICSIAYGGACAVVDGNVYRFLARYFGEETAIDSSKGQKCFKVLAEEVLNKAESSLHNQAMMEMGALQCTPTSPRCATCPFNGECVAYKLGKVEQLPRKEKKSKVRDRYFTYLRLESGGKLFLHKRTADDVWKNMYELPLIETATPLTLDVLLASKEWKTIVGEQAKVVENKHVVKHVLSHQRIYAQCLWVELEKPTPWLKENCVAVAYNEVERYPISRLVEKMLE